MEIKKSKKLHDVRYDIRGKVSTLATKMEYEGTQIIKLNTGNPAAFGFKPPGNLVDLLSRDLQLTAAYSDSKGLLTAREAIVEYEKSKGIQNVHIDRVFTGNGVSELITMSMQALLNEGDEILIPSPDYPLWTAAARLAGGTVVHYICDDKADWLPSLEDIERKINSRTRAIVVISPNNPTGAVYPKEILEGICNLARQHKLLILSDEIYDRLLMDNEKHFAISSLAPDIPVITLNGLSKSHQLCGFRAGWMVIGGNVTGLDDFLDGINVLASMRLCSNVLAQSIIPTALADPHYAKKELLPGGRLYEQREQAYVGMKSIPGISVVKPKAALYMFPKVDIEKFGIHDDELFVLDFLREKHVLLTHGRGYQWDKPDHFRLVYLPEKDVMADVIERLGDFLGNYRQKN